MKQKIFILEDMNINVKLHISPKDYPKSLNPDDADFFIHIDSNDDDFSEDTINSLDDAAGLIKTKVDKNPEIKQQYKFKIKKYGIYIRDEAKDDIELDFLYDVILSLVDEVQVYIDEGMSSENDDNEKTDETEYDQNSYEKENKNSNEINLEDDYKKNHINQQKQSTIDEEPIFKADENRRTSMKISKVSLSDTQTEDDGDNILKLLLNETKQDQK